MKRLIKIFIDFIMYIIFIYLMSYRAGRGLLLHAMLGITLFILFVLHNILNIKWYINISKGKYNFVRKIFIIINLLLFLDMIIMAISSIMMSGEVFSFSPFIATQFARDMHVVSTAWGFIFIIFHLGLHTYVFFKKIYFRIKKTYFKYIYILLFFIILFIGIYCFVINGIYNSILLISKKNHSFYEISFYFESIMMTIAASQIIFIIFEMKNIIKKKDN